MDSCKAGHKGERGSKEYGSEWFPDLCWGSVVVGPSDLWDYGLAADMKENTFK